MNLAMQPFAANGVLAGAISGQQVFAALIHKTCAPTATEVCYLDFDGVTFATVSFMRESIVAYRNHARAHWPNLYPVVANAAPVITEELGDFLRMRGDAMVTCELCNDVVRDPAVIGTVDGKQLTALDAILALREADAPQLALQFKDVEPISTTAWNNRLAALVGKGLLIEISSGRGKRYRPVLEGLTYGS